MVVRVLKGAVTNHSDANGRRPSDNAAFRMVSVRDDLYSMLFVTSIRPEYIFHYMKKKDITEEAIECMV